MSIFLALTIILTACNSPVSTNNSEPTEITTSSETICMYETATSQPSEQIDYDFKWEKQDSADFDKYVQEKCDGVRLGSYIWCFGFTNELNEMFTDFVNTRYGTSYKFVPFSKVNYFRSYFISNGESGNYHFKHDYEPFYNMCLRNDRFTLNNKLLLSFFVQNEIPFGAIISKECIENIYGDSIYIPLTKQVQHVNNDDSDSEFIYHVWTTKGLGNYEYSYMYSNKDLSFELMYYNVIIWNLCISEDIPCKSLFYGDPQYEEQCKDAIKLFNSHFTTYFGENAPQFGKVMTKEQYKAIFGEEPLDLSYIRGATNNPFAVIASPDGSIIEVH